MDPKFKNELKALIKEQIEKHFDLQKQLWISITCYDQNSKLLISKTIVDTDKTLEKVIDIIYKSFIEKIEKNISTVQCQIITQKTPIQNIQERKKQENQGLLVISTSENKSSLRISTTSNANDRNATQILDLTLKKHHMQTHDQLFILQLTPITIVI